MSSVKPPESTSAAAPPGALALIVGSGAGLSAALARAFAVRSYQVVLASRDTTRLESLVNETGAVAVNCDAAERQSVSRLFERVDALDGSLAVTVYNPSFRIQGPIVELDPEEVERSLGVTAYGAFLVAQQATRRFLEIGSGTLLFTGASASVRGYARSAPFAMGKFALRGLAQSLARELHPQGVHVGHVIVDGGIAGTPQRGRKNVVDAPDHELDPMALADAFLQLVDQPRSTWSWEIALRPWSEVF